MHSNMQSASDSDLLNSKRWKVKSANMDSTTSKAHFVIAILLGVLIGIACTLLLIIAFYMLKRSIERNLQARRQSDYIKIQDRSTSTCGMMESVSINDALYAQPSLRPKPFERSQSESAFRRRLLDPLIISGNSANEIPFTVPQSYQNFSGSVESPISRSPSSILHSPSANAKSAITVARSPTQRSATMSHSGSSAYLGSINPDLYRTSEEGDHLEFPDGNIGRLWFTIEYEDEAEKLNVTLLKIRNLSPRDPYTDIPVDPFVRLYLSPDERNPVQSKVKRKSCNPRFDQTFNFSATKSSLNERLLRFVVYDAEHGKSVEAIGYVKYGLNDFISSRQRSLTIWKDLARGEKEHNDMDRGELRCSLCYNSSLEQLTLSVIEYSNQALTRCKDPPDIYAKVTCCELSVKAEKSKKTKLVKKSFSPVFNESFVFKIPRDRMNSTSLTIYIMQNKPEKSLGRVILGGELCTKGNALEQWKKMMETPNTAFQELHALSSPRVSIGSTST